jgi:hypothetical protein
MDFVRIIFRDLRRNLRRTTMTITSIAVSLFVFCALMSFAKLPDQMRANANNSVRLVCRNKAGLGHGRIVAGRQPPELTAQALRTGRFDIPVDWVAQKRALGFSPPV